MEILIQNLRNFFRTMLLVSVVGGLASASVMVLYVSEIPINGRLIGGADLYLINLVIIALVIIIMLLINWDNLIFKGIEGKILLGVSLVIGILANGLVCYDLMELLIIADFHISFGRLLLGAIFYVGVILCWRITKGNLWKFYYPVSCSEEETAERQRILF